MKRFVTITAIVMAAAMAVPAATATWYGYGSREPDNAYDTNGGFVFPNAPNVPGDSATNKVYFNVVSVLSTDGGSLSPNSATLGGSVEATPTETFLGFMGIWVDCNHDGYIGFADAGLREYRAEASAAAGKPIDLGICGATGPADKTTLTHNGNGWITEMLPIGGSTFANTDWRYRYDATAAVWGDHLFPGQVIPAGAGATCTQTSYFPERGQASHTGGLIDHLDCLGVGPYALVTVVQATDPTPTTDAIPDPRPTYENGGALDKGTFGDGSSSKSYVTVENCGAPKNPPTVNSGGSVAGTFNQTVSQTGTVGPANVGTCNPNDGKSDFYKQLEASGTGTSASRRTVSDVAFQYRPFNNRLFLTAGGCAACGTPADAGVTEVFNAENAGCACWTARSATIPQLPTTGGSGLDRSTTVPTVDPDFLPANYMTFYGHTELTGVSFASPAAGTYGSNWCTSGIGTNAGVQNGWECDPALWNTDASGAHVQNPIPNSGGTYYYVGEVGMSYQVRDVDCYDSTVVQQGVAAGNPAVGAHSVPLVTKGTSKCT